LSALWSIEPTEAIYQSQLIFLSLVVFIVITAMTGKYQWFENLFIKIQLLVLLFSFALAFYKMSIIPYYDPYKVISVSANNNLYSGFLLISLSLVLSGYIRLKKAWKYLSVLVGIMAFFFIIIIQSRAVYLGVMVALVISLVIFKLRYKEVFSRRNIITGIISIVLLSIGIFIFTRTLDDTRRQYFLEKISIWEYFRSYEDLQARNIRRLHLTDEDDHTKMAAFDYSEDYYANANLRVIFWKKSLGLIALRPLTGVGAGNWRLAVAGVKDPPNPEHTIGNCTYSEPHNEWVRIISELGIIGIIIAFSLFFMPVAYVFYHILFSKIKSPPESLVDAAFITGFYLFTTFDFPLKRVEHNVLLWSVFAFMFMKVQLPSFRYGISLKSGWFSVLLLIGILFTLFLGIERFRGEYYTVKIFRVERKDDAKEIKYCHEAENFLYHITPNTLPVCWFEGVAHYRSGDKDLAEKCFLRALKMTPFEVRVLNDYSAVQYRLGRQVEAISTLRNTLDIDPFFDDARFNLGAIYYLTGQIDSARRQIKMCRESQKKTDFLEELNNHGK